MTPTGNRMLVHRYDVSVLARIFRNTSGTEIELNMNYSVLDNNQIDALFLNEFPPDRPARHPLTRVCYTR